MKAPPALAFARLSTGTKMLLILSAAMLPLGLIALLTSLDLARSAAIERRAAAHTATALYASQIEAVLDNGLSTVRAVTVSTQTPEAICDALARQAKTGATRRPPLALFDNKRRRICQSYGPPISQIAPIDHGVDHVWLDAKRRLFRFTAAMPRGQLAIEADQPVPAMGLKAAPEEGSVVS